MRTREIILLTLFVSASVGSEGISLQLQHVYKACENNIATACFELGELYREGIGVESDSSKAIEYYNKACDGGFDTGCSELEKLTGRIDDKK